MKKPVLIVTLGFPGSGKTYFSERLSKEKSFMHLNSDRTRFTIFKIPNFTKEETQGLFRLINYITEEFLKKGVSVIYDANVNLKSQRKVLERIAKKSGADYRLVWIQSDVSLAEKRLLKRTKLKDKEKKLLYPPLEVKILHLLKNQMEEPSQKKESHIVIDGRVSFKKQLKSFLLQTKDN